MSSTTFTCFCVLTIRKHLPKVDFERSGRGRDTMGESPQGFLLHYRMARAAQLLTESRLPISTISTMVSYPNQLHFSRAFKNVYGISPRDYRAKHFAL
jgi:AraC-like DNA-binding protein